MSAEDNLLETDETAETILLESGGLDTPRCEERHPRRRLGGAVKSKRKEPC
jgi:hypothetical protein